MKVIPATDAEWQTAVDTAAGLLLIHSAQLYGLVTGGPVVNADVCDEYLRAGRDRGIVPSDDIAEKVALAYTPPSKGGTDGD